MSITDSPVPAKEPPQLAPEASGAPAPPDRGRDTRGALSALAMRLHFYAGVFVAPFILIAAVTGALYAISPTLESIVDRDLLHVDSAGPARPLSEQIAAAVATEPGRARNAVAAPPHTGATTPGVLNQTARGGCARRGGLVDPGTGAAGGAGGGLGG
ncbi:PepSY domain-containing protein, partial [Nocardia wallacei]|uniref:PepSY domain-containing protein n=1 Tax=Nocardia wallacei TaxID=480035 RepID=UPI003CC7E049